MCACARVCVNMRARLLCERTRPNTNKELLPSRRPRRHHTGFFYPGNTHKVNRQDRAGVAALVIKFLAQRSAALKHRRGAESHWQVRVLSLLHHMLSFRWFGPVCIPAKQLERLIILLVNWYFFDRIIMFMTPVVANMLICNEIMQRGTWLYYYYYYWIKFIKRYRCNIFSYLMWCDSIIIYC